MKELPQTQNELNEFLSAKLLEQSNQLLMVQVLLYSLVDLVIEKNLLTKEEMECMIEDKKIILEKFFKNENKKSKKDDSSFMMHYGKPGEA
jgi:hypothetical protein